MYTIEYDSTTKKMPFSATWVDLETIKLSKVSQRKINITQYHLYVKFLI